MIGWHFSLGGVVDGEDHLFEILRIMLEKMISRVTKTTQREQILHQEWHSNSRREDLTHPAFSTLSSLEGLRKFLQFFSVKYLGFRNFNQLFTITGIYKVAQFQIFLFSELFRDKHWDYVAQESLWGDQCNFMEGIEIKGWEQKILVRGLTEDLTHPAFKTRTLYHQKNRNQRTLI